MSFKKWSTDMSEQPYVGRAMFWMSIAWSLLLQAACAGGPSSGTDFGSSSPGVATEKPLAQAPAAPTSATQDSAPNINTLSITNPGNAEANYPLQFGRVFRAAEIKSGACPQVVYKGVLLPTQADIKNRWPDGSVKFAVVSVVLPSIGKRETADMSLRSGQCGDASGATRDEMLAGPLNFDARISIDGGASGVASAREMIKAGNYQTWTQGAIVTTIIASDHEGKRFDLGPSASHALRPVFHIQFWRQLGAYKVRFVVEQSDTTKLQNQSYSVALSMGNANPVSVYTNPKVDHVYASRWTKEYWGGSRTAVPLLGIKHNVGYLASTYAIPNYDNRITLSTDSRNAIVYEWGTKAKNLYGDGFWTKYMPTTGGRGDIGLFPSWQIAALYGGDAELWSMARQLSDLAGAWPMHFRTGDERVFDTMTKARALGRVATRDSHPTQFLRASNDYMNGRDVNSKDWFTTLGVLDPLGWVPDTGHQPDPWYLLYLVTGEFWYLEQLQFWASWGLFSTNPNGALWGSGRNPSDTVISEEMRGMAWLLRTRARAAYASVDGSVEKAYFTRTVEQALRVMEGKYIGTGTDPIRSWWAANGLVTNNPLRYFSSGFADPWNAVTPNAATFDSPWMQSMLIQALGHAKELGFGAGPVLSWASQSWIKMILESDGRHLADYRMPVTDLSGKYFQSWPQAYSGIIGWSPAWESTLPDLQHGYAIFAIAAVSYISNEVNGQAAWNWAKTNGYDRVAWGNNPKMAILPR
jgi:hypothetical protein